MRRTDRGQATVELALAIPLVALVAVGLLQVVMVFRDQVLVDLAAREAARAAAVTTSSEGAAEAAARRVLDGPADVGTTVADGLVTVTVTVTPTEVPFVGWIVRDRELVGRATMALEPP